MSATLTLLAQRSLKGQRIRQFPSVADRPLHGIAPNKPAYGFDETVFVNLIDIERS